MTVVRRGSRRLRGRRLRLTTVVRRGSLRLGRTAGPGRRLRRGLRGRGVWGCRGDRARGGAGAARGRWRGGGLLLRARVVCGR
ncbi:hypothetical protein AB0A66_22405 [Streptomyces longwoodensis]|uniref:hypothetical protein n=1 Tax=Streptomyces longwoodensis TaxID=68231 RepID=UPI0033E22DF8